MVVFRSFFGRFNLPEYSFLSVEIKYTLDFQTLNLFNLTCR